MPEAMIAAPVRTRIAVAICTYKRNDFLTRLLDALLVCADRVRDRAAVGVAIVDDTADGQARIVADAFAGKFELGVQYRISGKQNISMARNIAIETAMEMGDWTAMTDDDCEPPPHWLEALLDLQQTTGDDAVTGRLVRRVPPDSPRWITEQPFLELGQEELPDGGEMKSAATFNSMVSSSWLKNHPKIRFEPKLGVISGEDVVFFRACRAAGLKIRFSEKGFVYENEGPERATFGYQLYVYLWHGNSSYVGSVESGISPARMFVHGCASMARALVRPFGRVVRGQPPQFRYCLALVLHATGKMLGPFGVRIDHK
ncbi:MAG TPA: glycosyltransferase [Sphingomicrobium sp.]|jgi:GT2 family glycosyltransferase|nr:glycosyltransferase [Sphingomicrobium sp.]